MLDRIGFDICWKPVSILTAAFPQSSVFVCREVNSMAKNDILKHKAINGWRLFWLVTIPLSAAVIYTMTDIELNRARNVSSMIQFSVRCAVPWLFVAFAASSVHVVFPSALSRWWLRNRKYLGLCFAAGMAWQLFFILWLVGVYSEHYFQRVYVLSDAVEGVVGYLFLIAMTITSFKFGRDRISSKNWKRLHKSGIYFLWGYAWIVYWYQLFYYNNPVLIDYVYYWMGTLAWGIRAWAWTKKRMSKQAKASTSSLLQLAQKSLGLLIVIVGLVAFAFGSPWSKPAFKWFGSFDLMNTITQYVPYFPFVTFFPLLLVLIGCCLIVGAANQKGTTTQSA
jgi:hypothetical protein